MSAKTVKVDLPADIFDAPVNIPLMHQVVVAQQAAARQGTHDVKSRGEVRGGGRKPYKQKGTGRARQGSTRAPQFAGGLEPVDSATVVRSDAGEMSMTDGPYAESKEQMGGFWVIEAADLDAALEWARKGAAACEGPVEVRPFQR